VGCHADVGSEIVKSGDCGVADVVEMHYETWNVSDVPCCDVDWGNDCFGRFCSYDFASGCADESR